MSFNGLDFLMPALANNAEINLLYICSQHSKNEVITRVQLECFNMKTKASQYVIERGLNEEQRDRALGFLYDKITEIQRTYIAKINAIYKGIQQT